MPLTLWESNHFLPLLVPHSESNAGKTGHEGEARFGL